MESKGFHTENIQCPKCGILQFAKVEHTYPFNTYVHECTDCRYIITESEWNVIGNRLFRVDNIQEQQEINKQDADYSFALLIGGIEKIRKEFGAYIWVYPMKWKDEKGDTYKEVFLWEIERETGECINYNYDEQNEFITYQQALENAIQYFNTTLTPLPSPPKTNDKCANQKQ